jgi:hypothetical protein
MADGYEFGSAGGGADIAGGGISDANSDSGSPAFFLGGSDGSGSGSASRDAAGTEFDGSIHAGLDKFNADGTFRKRRGRKSGSAGSSGKRQTRASADYSASVDSLARMLGYLHVGIAAASRTPELVITEDESKALAGATARVLEEFDIRPDPKVEAIVGLVTTAGAIYGPKVYFIRERKKAEREEQ